MIKIYPAQFVHALTSNYSKDDIIEIEVRKLNNMISKISENNYNMNECCFDEISSFIENIIFSRHQSIISYNKIYLLNSSETRNRIDAYSELYAKVDYNLIFKVWNEI